MGYAIVEAGEELGVIVGEIDPIAGAIGGGAFARPHDDAVETLSARRGGQTRPARRVLGAGDP